MFRFLLFAVTLLIGFQLEAQISPDLQQRLTETSKSFIPIRVEFVNTVDFNALESYFVSHQSSVAERARIVNRVLLKQAQQAQASAQILLGEKAESIKAYRSFYIVNMMVLTANPDLIRALAQLPEVSLIDLAEDEFLIHDPIVESNSNGAEVVNGTEPGLLAINAQELWKLGYTGRGRMVYNYDTGVWASHPSFNDRFLGNFAPLGQSWYGLLYDYPDGRISDHGTHTLGTIAGLDTATSDTIGVAFGAYWIANDFVASTVADLPALAQMVAAFEWALNPDGDTATSDDIPDVINNSWRWRDDPDTVHCGGFIVNLMNAIEATGMANVFSGGNSGPGNATVNSPQRINTSDVNTFSVGSIDGNQPFPHPISNFSTRGPTQCPGSGSLLIHPEVVAPGQNVRSAWGQSGYNTISGTSMAAPHVSGAVLLLKEAFPQLTGAQLLQALYNSAIDMGVAGEDNTYGNGLINVWAAYQLLSATHTPVNPNDVAWDLAIKSISYPSGGEVTCVDIFAPVILVENLGDSAISQVEVTLWMDGVMLPSMPLTVNTTNMLRPGDKHVITTTSVNTSVAGDHELMVSVRLAKTEYDDVNNQRVIRFNKRPTNGLPFIDDFESGIAVPDWYTNNEDGLLSWDSTVVKGWPGNTHAAFVNLGDYLPRNDQEDAIWSPVLSMPAMGSLNLSFDMAYQLVGPIALVQDTFKVLVSTNCAQSFDDVLYEKFGTDLNTSAGSGSGFEPASRSDWRREHIDLSAYNGQEIILAFQTVNRKGNNLYLDNISVYEGLWDPISVQALESDQFAIYPNPAQNTIRISTSSRAQNQKLEVQILDVNGRMVASHKVAPEEDINLDRLAKGVYVMKVNSQSASVHLRFVKE